MCHVTWWGPEKIKKGKKAERTPRERERDEKWKKGRKRRERAGINIYVRQGEPRMYRILYCYITSRSLRSVCDVLLLAKQAWYSFFHSREISLSSCTSPLASIETQKQRPSSVRPSMIQMGSALMIGSQARSHERDAYNNSYITSTRWCASPAVAAAAAFEKKRWSIKEIIGVGDIYLHTALSLVKLSRPASFSCV